MRRRMLLLTLILVLALVLVFGLVGSALAATPANNGQGQDFGQHHAGMAQLGLIGKDMNPGMHQGFSGWDGM